MDPQDYHDPSISQQQYIEHNRIRLNPQQAITGTSFSGNFSFDINVSKDQCILLPETKLYMSFSGLQTRDNGAGGGALHGICDMSDIAAYDPVRNRFIGCFASGGVMNTLSKLHLEIGDGGGTIQAIENVPQLNQLLRMTQDTINLSMEEGTDPFFIIEQGETIGRNATNPTTGSYKTYKSHDFRRLSIIETIVKNANRQGLLANADGSKNVTLSSSLPLSLFQEEIKAYQGKYTLRCFIDPNWRNNLIMSLAVAPPIDFTDKRCFSYKIIADAPTTVQFSDLPAVPQNSIYLAVTDVWLEVSILKITERPRGIRNILLNPFNHTINNIQTGIGATNLTISVAPHTHKIIIGFQKTDYRDVIPSVLAAAANETDVTLDSGMSTLFPAICLQSISVRFLDNSYPNTPYNLRLLHNDCITTGVDTANTPATNTSISQYSKYEFIALDVNSTPAQIMDYINSAAEQCPLDIRVLNNKLEWQDTIRAYNDFCLAMEYDLHDRPLTFAQWVQNPLFCFKFISSTNVASNIDVQLTFNGNTSQAFAMHTTYYHKGLLTCNYGEDAVQYTYNYLV